MPNERQHSDSGNPLSASSGFRRRVNDWLTSVRRTGVHIPVTADDSYILPRFMPAAEFKRVFTTPEGMRVVPNLARAFDPRGSAFGPVEEAIIGRQAGVQVGKHIAALWARVNPPARRLFVVDDEGALLLANNTRWYLSDVMEAEMRRPGSQPITPEQRAWLNDTYVPLLKDFRAMLSKEGVGFHLDIDGNPVEFNQFYFPRPAIDKKGKDAPTGPGQPPGGPSSPGAKGFFQKSRSFATEKEGADYGIVYDPDPISRVAKLIAGGYRAVADHRLATDTALEGRPLAEYPWVEYRQVSVAPAFEGWVYPTETAKKLESRLNERDGRLEALPSVRDWPRSLRNLLEAGMLTPIQKAIVGAGVFALAATSGYVPWTYTWASQGLHRERPAGYAPIFDSPPPEDLKRLGIGGVKIDAVRAVIPMVLVVCGTVAGVVLTGRRRSDA